jgi:hypothetical protein
VVLQLLVLQQQPTRLSFSVMMVVKVELTSIVKLATLTTQDCKLRHTQLIQEMLQLFFLLLAEHFCSQMDLALH